MLTVSREALLSNGSDHRFREMLHNLLAFSSSLEQIRGRFAAFIGLSGPQYTILITVRQLSTVGHVGVSQVAEHLGLTPTFVTIETKRLVTLGMVEKKADPDDLRRVRLRVTPEGEARLHRLAPFQQQINDQLFEPVTASNFDLLHLLSSQLRQSADDALALSNSLSGGAERSA